MSFYTWLQRADWQRHGIQLVRTKNGFHHSLPPPKGGYRDLKAWVLVNTHHATAGGELRDDHGRACRADNPLVLELQVQLADLFKKKPLMHLPYECSRGSYEHDAFKKGWFDLLKKSGRLLDKIKHVKARVLTESCSSYSERIEVCVSELDDLHSCIEDVRDIVSAFRVDSAVHVEHELKQLIQALQEKDRTLVENKRGSARTLVDNKGKARRIG